tara:strand:- start:353 stop:715 length:363 start_codon:yes stop_codon:yes gene_type:complete
MAFGTLKADTLTHSTAGSLATNFVVEGSAKAWCRASTAAALNDSFNIASGTDSGTGDYEFTFTNNMETSLISGSATAVSSAGRLAGYHGTATTGYGIEVHDTNGNKGDAGTHHQTFGDLA